MNIQTVATNLRVTIAGKEKMLATLQQRVSIERTPIDQTAFVAVINFLEININELRRILQDVEVCCEQANEASWALNPERMGR
jgi:hypothetical protein